MGMASIGTDKPTRDKLKAAAASSGMTLLEYLRVLADSALTDKQGGMTLVYPVPRSDTSKHIEAMASQALEMAKMIHWPESKQMALVSALNKAVKFNDSHIAQVLFDNVEAEFEAVRAKVEAKEAGQLELKNEACA